MSQSPIRLRGLRYVLPAFAFISISCSDSTGPGQTMDFGYDLVFDGEVSPGRPMLYRVAPEAGSPRLLGTGHVGRRPAPSPDGRFIAYSWGEPDDDPAILLLADDAPPVTLVGGPGEGATEPVWSHDGTRLAFTGMGEDALGDVFTAAFANGRLENTRNLTPPLFPAVWLDRTPAWSPDGTRIAFASARSGGSHIWIMNTDGTGLRRLIDGDVSNQLVPSWSPDGQWIAYQHHDSFGIRIAIVSVDGGEPRILPWPAHAYHPAWSPDGRMIAFASNVDGDLDIFVVGRDGEQMARIRRAGNDRHPAWIRR